MVGIQESLFISDHLEDISTYLPIHLSSLSLRFAEETKATISVAFKSPSTGTILCAWRSQFRTSKSCFGTQIKTCPIHLGKNNNKKNKCQCKKNNKIPCRKFRNRFSGIYHLFFRQFSSGGLPGGHIIIPSLLRVP